MSHDPTPPSPPSQDYKLWLWVAGAFILLIAAWTTIILLARENQPVVIPLETP